MRVERAHEQPIAEDGQAAVRGIAAAVGQPGRELATVPPDLTAAAHVDGPGVVAGTASGT